jgi:integrase
MAVDLHNELEKLGLVEAERDVFISLLGVVDDDVFQILGVEQISAHVARWYEVGLDWFSFDDEEDLLKQFEAHLELLHKVSKGTRRVFSRAIVKTSYFGPLFDDQPKKDDMFVQERDFGRFIFFHVMRYLLRKHPDRDHQKCINDFSRKFLKKQDIDVVKTNIGNADINNAVFPKLTKDLKKFIGDYVFVRASDFHDASAIPQSGSQTIATNTNINNKPSPLPIKIQQSHSSTNQNTCSNQTSNVYKLYPCLPKETDYQSHQRHDDQALNLPWLTYSLSNREKGSLIKELILDLHSHTPEALFYLLMIQMAKNSDDVFSTPLIWEQTVDGPGLYPSLNLIALEHIELQNQYTALRSNTSLNIHNDLIILPMGNRISNAILAFNSNNRFEYVFEMVDPVKFDINYRNNLKRRAGIARRILSDKALQYLLFSEVSMLSDPVTASQIFASDKFNNPISLYYRSMSAIDAAELYHSSLKSIGITSEFEPNQLDGHIGSQLSINQPHFVDRIQKIKLRIGEGINGVKTIEQFNDFALYTALILMLNGLTRRTNQLFFSSNTISINKKLLLVCDKYTEAYSAVRLLPLTDSAISQLIEYKKSLKYFATKLSKVDRNSYEVLYSHYNSHKAEDIAMVCMVKNGCLSPISTNDIVSWLDLDIPENFARHLMASSLPESLQPYTQILLGHYNQKQHANDPFSLDPHAFPQHCIDELDETINKLGVVPISIPSVRGDTRNSKTLSDFSPNYYPLNWLQREQRNVVTIRQLKKMLPAQTFLIQKQNDIDETFDTLLQEVEQTNGIEQSIATKYINDWKLYFKRTASTSLRRSYIDQKIHVNTPLQLVEFDSTLAEFRERYVDYVSDDAWIQNEPGFILFIGICLFQPYFAKRIYKDRPTELSPHIVNKSLFLTYFNSENVEQSYPTNYLTAGLFLKYQLSMDTISINWSSRNTTFNAFFDFVKTNWSLSYSPKAFSTPNKFVTNCIRNSVLTHSALIKTDGDNNSLASTHYPLKELSRMVLPFEAFERVPLQPVAKSITHALSLYQRRGNKRFTQSQEDKIYNKLHGFLNKTDLKGEPLASEFRSRWASCINADSEELSELLIASSRLSQYMFALLWYIHDYCLRPSQRKKPLEAGTIYGYISTLNTALQSLCSIDIDGRDIRFLELDDESYIYAYREALSKTDKDNKQDLAKKIYDFHQQLVKYFAIDDILWDEYIPELNNTYKPKGIARAMSPEEFARSFVFLQNVTGMSDYERCVHLVVLILGYRAGLRKQEVKNLKYYDIDVESWVIEVASSQFAATKSINSPRRVCVSDYLNDEEKDILKRLVQSSKVNRQLYPSQLLFGNHVDNPFLDIEKVFKNVVDVIKAFTGNDKFRYYDLRHNFINYNLLLLSDVKYDIRYQEVLSQWARTNDLESFSDKVSSNLLGRTPDHGATLTLAFAKFMGHSIHTQREYYQHCLHIIGEVQANRLVDQHLSNKSRKALHLTDSPKLVKHYCKQVQQALAKKEQAPQKFKHCVTNPTLVFGAETALYQDIQYRCLILHDLIFQIQNIEQCAQKYNVNPELLEHLMLNVQRYVTETEHIGIPLNWYLNNQLKVKPEIIQRYSRHLYAPGFQTLLEKFITLKVSDDVELKNFIKVWMSRADGSTLIVSDDEAIQIAKFALKIELEADQRDAVLSKKLQLMGKNIKLRQKGAYKYCMEKLSLVIALIYSVNE